MIMNNNDDFRELLEMQKEVEIMSRKISRLAERYAVRLQNQVKTRETFVTCEHDVEKVVTDYLLHLGMSINLLGFKYSRAALVIILAEKEAKRFYYTKELYPEVAKQFGTTSSRVERGIRNAISTMFAREEKNDELAEITIKASKCCPSNSEFLTFVAEKIRLKM